MPHANVDLVRDGYATFGKGDLDTLRDRFFAPDIIWHYAGRSQLAGHYHGIDQVMGWLSRTYDLSEGTLRIDLHDVVGNDDHVIALAIVHAARDGKQLADQGVQVFHVRDGQVTEVWTLPGDQYTTDDFWG